MTIGRMLATAKSSEHLHGAAVVASDPDSRPRTRRKHHKVATGCANCKRRRIKCDETEHGCQRCRRANLFCPGYNPPRARIFESSTSTQPSSPPAEVSSILQSSNSISFPSTIDCGPNLRFVWQSALLDSFLTTWLPHSLVRAHAQDKTTDSMVPMSAWPLVSWKLAKREDESFVAHALLCLTLCVIGSQTGDFRLVAEAAQHYARVLHQFQAQISLLAKRGYSSDQDDHVASLAAAGFCCSQVEYILDSWANGDRHLEGMASLLQACGPACLKYENTRSIFCDHYLLWSSCAITHRRPSIYSKHSWINMDWPRLPDSRQSLIATAARVPPLLEQFDTLKDLNDRPALEDLLHKLVDVVVDIENLGRTENFFTNPEDSIRIEAAPSTPCEVSDDSFHAVVMTGYSSAFVQHAGIAAWEIIRSQEHIDAPPTLSGLHLTHDRLRSGCERHLTQICNSINALANDRFGMITASPLLFLLDSAWMGYRALQDFCGYDLDIVRPWFVKVGKHVAGTGYRPLREPWLTMEDAIAVDVLSM